MRTDCILHGMLVNKHDQLFAGTSQHFVKAELILKSEVHTSVHTKVNCWGKKCLRQKTVVCRLGREGQDPSIDLTRSYKPNICIVQSATKRADIAYFLMYLKGPLRPTHTQSYIAPYMLHLNLWSWHFWFKPKNRPIRTHYRLQSSLKLFFPCEMQDILDPCSLKNTSAQFFSLPSIGKRSTSLPQR